MKIRDIIVAVRHHPLCNLTHITEKSEGVTIVNMYETQE